MIFFLIFGAAVAITALGYWAAWIDRDETGDEQAARLRAEIARENTRKLTDKKLLLR